MNIVTEANIAGPPIVEKPRGRPVRMLRWFIIVGLLLALLVGALVGFNALRSHGIAQFFANNKPPPATVTVVEAKSEMIPNLLTAVGDLAAVHQVNVTSDVSGRITDIMFTAGASVKAGNPLVQLFDGPEQGALASFKPQAPGGVAKTEAIISQKLVRAPFDGELGVRRVEVGQFLTAGTQIVTLTDLSPLYATFPGPEKASGA